MHRDRPTSPDRDAVPATPRAVEASPRLAVIGTYGNANLGDDSLLTSFLQWVRREAPTTRVLALSTRPEAVERSFAVEAVDYGARPVPPSAGSRPHDSIPSPVIPQHPPSAGVGSRWKAKLRVALPLVWSALVAARLLLATLAHAAARFPAQLRTAKSLDGLIVLGGGQIFDHWGGQLGHPLTLASWSWACRLAGKPLLVVSVGGRPVNSTSAKLLRSTLSSASYLSLRDPDTIELVRGFGVDREIRLVPDLAFGLAPPPSGERPLRPRVIGVSPMAYRRPGIDPEASAEHYTRYIDTLAVFCERLATCGYEIVMFASQTRSDPVAIDDLCSRLSPAAASRVRVQDVTSFDDLLRCIRETDANVATRFHGVLLSLVSSRPVLSISYQPRKNDRLLEPFDLMRLGLSVDEIDADALWLKFGYLVENYGECCAKIDATVPRLRDEVHSQYRYIFAQQGWSLASGEPRD